VGARIRSSALWPRPRQWEVHRLVGGRHRQRHPHISRRSGRSSLLTPNGRAIGRLVGIDLGLGFETERPRPRLQRHASNRRRRRPLLAHARRAIRHRVLQGPGPTVGWCLSACLGVVLRVRSHNRLGELRRRTGRGGLIGLRRSSRRTGLLRRSWRRQHDRQHQRSQQATREVHPALGVMGSLSPFAARCVTTPYPAQTNGPFIRLSRAGPFVAGDAAFRCQAIGPTGLRTEPKSCVHFTDETAASRRYNPD